MNLLDLMVKISVDDQASAGVEKIAGGIKSGLGAAATAAAAGIAAVTGAVATLTTASVNAYSDYQQLTGGVETLFGTSADKLMAYAETAYQTAGMSANTYMETATSFSASLLQGLGNDTAAAVEIANLAITDMSDNANKMGTDINSIRDAYQGFAKDNYDMLDNLKLGYGGTASEMARLVNESGVLGDSMKVTAETVKDVPFDKMIEAIHQVQSEMGITGTTAVEASTTIQGSISSAKAAWDNWLAGMANPDADMGALTDQLVQSVIVAGENIVPAIGTVMANLVTTATTYAPQVGQAIMSGLSQIDFTAVGQTASDMLLMLVDGIVQNLPMLATAALQIVMALGQGLITNGPQILASLGQLLLQLANYIIQNVPNILNAAVQFFGMLIQGIAQNAPTIIATLVSLLGQLIAQVISWAAQMLGQAISAGAQFLSGLAGQMSQVPGRVAEFLNQVINDLIEWVSGVAEQAMEAGSQFLESIQDGFNSAVEWVSGVPQMILDALGDLGSLLWDAGSSIISGLWEGMRSAAGGLFDWVGGIASDIAALKGPLPYDRKLLIPNGTAIMDSLYTGLRRGWPQVESLMKQMTSDIQNYPMDFTASVREVRVGSDSKPIVRETGDTYNFYNPVKTPYETARAIRMQKTYGLAGARK